MIARVRAWLLAAAVGIPAAAAASPVAAPGFVVENAIPGSHIEAPVALAFTPDGRLLVADVPGRVWVIRDGVQQSVPMWAHEDEVEINGDCGLLGMALDPGFANNRYLYLYYAVDPDSNGVDDDSVHFCRLVRYQVSATNPDRVDESTRTVLLGTSFADGAPNASGTHSAGALRFAPDGTLLVSVGEGAGYAAADSGGHDPALFAPGRAPAAWDRGAFRAQMLACPGGKVLRIDPATGRGVPGNPFWTGDPAAVESKVWAFGLRNPFRFCLRPGTGSANPAAADPGVLYIGDVGWNTWEELDVTGTGGANFGWPCREGARDDAPYQVLSPSFGDCGTMAPSRDPVLAISHVSPDSSAPSGVRGNAIVSGLFYTHTQFPAPWRGTLILGDFLRGWVRAARFDAQQRLTGWDELANGMNGPVDFAIEPSTGWLYVACIIDDTVRRIRWAPAADAAPASATLAPHAVPNPTRGAIELSIPLTAATRFEVEIVDAAGRAVWRSGAVDHAAGTARVRWDGRDARGARAAPGVYLARVVAGGERRTLRIARLR